jgi:8-oxo-dGTP diphosphatase
MNGNVLCIIIKKINILMQIGGHIELNETPWQAVAHELVEESGYELNQLDILQFTKDQIKGVDGTVHPIPFASNTHLIGNLHYHSDSCYGFITDEDPRIVLADNESSDLRWLTLPELDAGNEQGEVLKDAVVIYRFLIDHIDDLIRIPASSFSLEKPHRYSAKHIRGAPDVQ